MKITGLLVVAALAPLTVGAHAMTKRPTVADDKLDSCSANRVSAYVGKQASAEVRSAVERTARADRTRWITPDTMVTMDYRSDRLNVHLGTDGKIGSFSCG